MAEVGVLNLQIQDNSAKAAAGLSSLASALERVRTAVGSGLNLSGVATQITKINTAVQTASSGGAVNGLNKTASALQKIKDASSEIKMPSLNVSGDLGMQNVTESVNTANESVKELGTGFTDVESSIEQSMEETEDKVSEATENVKEFTEAVKEAKQASGIETWYDPAVKDFVPMSGHSTLGKNSASSGYSYQGEDPVLASILDRNGYDFESLRSRYPWLNEQIDNQFPDWQAWVENEKALGMEEVTPEIEEASEQLDSFSQNADSASASTSSLGNSIKSMFPTLSQLSSQLFSIAKRMALRAVIKNVSSALSEGVENVYWYSKAVGTDFADSMDSASSALSQFKNSIGAAATPLITSLVPALVTVINWLTTAVNYLNQFFSLITGKSTWTKATTVSTEAFTKTTKAATGASDSIKELLADWDELNIIQSESSSGGSGSGSGNTDDYASMFEEVSTFDNDLKAFVENLEEEFGSILTFVEEIGAALLAWKLSSATLGAISTIAGLVGTGIILDITFKLVQAFDKTYAETGNAGWLIGDVLTTMLGATLTSKILNKVLGGVAGKIAIPLTLAVSAGATIKAIVEETDLTALSKRTVTQAILAAVKGGAATGLFIKSIGLASSTLAAVGAGVAGTLITFGAAIGIKATSVVASTGTITKETIIADVASVLSTTLGVAGLALALGASAPVVAAATAGALIFTAAATIGIQAIIASKPVAIEWGNRDWTEQEIKNFVEGSVFKVSPKTILDLMDPKIQAVSTSEEGLTATAEEVKLLVNKVALGFDDNETLKDLETQILGTSDDDSDSLIGKLRQTMKDKNSVIETGLTLQFTDYGSGKMDNSKEVKDQFNTVSAGWDAIDKEISALGKSLSESFGRAYKEGITEEAKAAEIKTIAELSQMIANVSAALTKGEALAQAQINLNDALSNISGESFGDIVRAIEEYKNEVTSAYTTAYDAVIKELGSQAAALKQSWENELQLAEEATTESERNEHTRNAAAYETQYNETYALYKSKLDGRNQAIKDAADNAIDSGTMDMIKDVISNNIQGKAGTESIDVIMRSALLEKFESGEATSSDVTQLLNQMIDSYFGADANTVKALIEEGVLSYSDVINEGVTNGLRAGLESSDAKSLWDTIIDQIFGTDTDPVEAEPTDIELPVNLQTEIEEATSEASTTDEVLGGLSAEAETNLAATDEVITTHILPPLAPVDTSDAVDSVKNASNEIVGYVDTAISALDTLNSLSGGFSYSGGAGRFGSATGVTMQTKAAGGNIRSGEMFFANENGNIEMMGKMGNSAVVANNQQIVDGISRGVAASNSGMESSMSQMVTLMRQFVTKEFTAKVVPSASMGRSNAMSNEAYRKVTG